MAISIWILYGEAQEAVRGSFGRFMKSSTIIYAAKLSMAISIWILYGEAQEAEDSWKAVFIQQSLPLPFQFEFCTGKLRKLYGEALEDSGKALQEYSLYKAKPPVAISLEIMYAEALEAVWGSSGRFMKASES